MVGALDIMSGQELVQATNPGQIEINADDWKADFLKTIVSEGKVISYEIEFNDSNEISKESEEVIQRLGQLLLENPDICLDVQCHTTVSGSEQDDEILTQLRAEAIKTAINDQGIEDARIMASGKGSYEPLEANDTEEGRKKNTRVEFVKL